MQLIPPISRRWPSFFATLGWFFLIGCLLFGISNMYMAPSVDDFVTAEVPDGDDPDASVIDSAAAKVIQQKLPPNCKVTPVPGRGNVVECAK